MPPNHKIVRDPIHGDIEITDLIDRLLATPEVQRLNNIKQLGFAHLVFPGAHHTRLEHSLGAYHLARKVAYNLELSEEETQLITCAALLHDIGHGPFSHTLESLLFEKFHVDHVALTQNLILGKYDIYSQDEKKVLSSERVSDILDAQALDKQVIAHIIAGHTPKQPYLAQILNSTIDIDQLDYLMRDAYYTGVSYGSIDLDRLLQTLMIFHHNLAVKRKGVSVLENILMARGLMYSSVYFHKTVRIAELMLSKALELLLELDPLEFFKMTDGELMSAVKEKGTYQYEIVTRLKFRHLFKQAYMLSISDRDTYDSGVLKALEKNTTRRKKEQEFEQKCGIPPGHIIIDMPLLELQRAEPRIQKTDIGIIEHDQVRQLDEFTPIAQAIRSRIAPEWVLMIISEEKYRTVIAEKAEKILLA